MLAVDIDLDGTDRLRRIQRALASIHGIDLNLNENSEQDDVATVLKFYENLKTAHQLNSSFNSCMSHPDYTKAVLICEACRVLLKEIFPSRKTRKRR
jgi:hypothetical protein